MTQQTGSRTDLTVTGVYIDSQGDAQVMNASGSSTPAGLSGCISVINGNDRATIIQENNVKTWYIYASGTVQGI